MVQYQVLNGDDFQAEYAKAFQKVAVPTETAKDTFRRQVFTVQEAVVEALKQKWKERDDFEVGWDFDYCRHACGGIYSEAAFSKAYVETVADALRKVDSEGTWTYHTVCEIIVNPHGKTIGDCVETRGQFFHRDGVCYIDGAMSPHHRRRLGCGG